MSRLVIVEPHSPSDSTIVIDVLQREPTRMSQLDEVPLSHTRSQQTSLPR